MTIKTCIGLAAIISTATLTAQDAPPLPQQPGSPGGPHNPLVQKLESAQKDLQELSEELTGIQRQASEKEKVQKALKPFEETIYGKMKIAAPDLSKEIDQVQKITDKLRKSDELPKPPEERSPEFEQTLQQYQQLKQQLAPIEREVSRDPEVVQLGTRFQEVLIATMQEINPKTEKLMENQQNLVRQIQSLQQTVIQQQQQQQRQQQQQFPPQEQPPRP